MKAEAQVSQPPVITLLNTLAKQSARVVSGCPDEPSMESLLTVDTDLSGLRHMAMHLHLKHGDELPDESFTPAILNTLGNLQVRAVTAFNRPLFSTERSEWVDDLDRLSTECHRMALAMQHADKLLQQEIKRETKKQRLAKKLRKSADGGLASQLGVLKEQMVDAGEWEADKPNEEEQEERKLRRRELSTEHWYDKEAAKLAEAARFDVGYLNPAHDVGIIQYPVILTYYRFSREADGLLTAAGIRTAKVYGSYLQIHNCRLIGIKVGTLPGNAVYARRYAQDLLTRMQETPEWGSSCRKFFLAQANPLVGQGHTYYVLLPDTCKGHVYIEEWGWGQDVSNGFLKTVEIKNGKKITRTSDIPAPTNKKVTLTTKCGQSVLVEGEQVKAVSGTFDGTTGTVAEDGPNRFGKVRVNVDLFGRHTTAQIPITDLTVITE